MTLFDADGFGDEMRAQGIHVGLNGTCAACGRAWPCPFAAPEPVVPDPTPQFDGETYNPEFDYARLGKQMRAVADVMLDGRWHTLGEVEAVTGAPQASISARLRDLRKPKFGGHTVDRQHRGPVENGLYEYRLTRNLNPGEER